MISGNKTTRRMMALLSAVALAATLALVTAHDRVSEICVYGGRIDYCAPEG